LSPAFPVFSFDEPHQAAPDKFIIEFSNLRVLEFRYTAIQLNCLD